MSKCHECRDCRDRFQPSKRAADCRVSILRESFFYPWVSYRFYQSTIGYRQTQEKKSLKNLWGNFHRLDFLAWHLHIFFPPKRGVFSFSHQWGVASPKGGGGINTIGDPNIKMYHLNMNDRTEQTNIFFKKMLAF